MKAIRQIARDVSPHWVGDGFPVRSLFSYADGNRFDPFLLLDYAGPYEFPPSEARRGVGQHPHRGFETVTIVYQGELEHGDSAGNHGAIGPGDVQWMTAASGVLHEEFHSSQFARQGGTLEMVQLWVNLPAAHKMSPPRYQEILSGRIPVVELPSGAGTLRVIAGQFQEARGPAQAFSPIQLWDLRLVGGGKVNLEVAERDTTLLVVQRGAVSINAGQAIRGVTLVEFEQSGREIKIEAIDDAQALLLSGTPLGEPVIGQGPFVMNTPEEIRQAFADFQSGRFASAARSTL